MRHFVVIPSEEDVGPVWDGGTPVEQGYHVLPVPYLKRSSAKHNEYHVFTSETEYTAVEADSAVHAVSISQVKSPFKVVHAHSRIADVIDTEKLSYVGYDTSYMKSKGFVGELIEEYPEAKPAGQTIIDAPNSGDATVTASANATETTATEIATTDVTGATPAPDAPSDESPAQPA